MEKSGGFSFFKKHKEHLTLVLLCILWYGIAAGSNFLGKILLSEFPYPMTASANQHFCTSVLSFPLIFILRRLIKREETKISWKFYFKYVVPLVFLKVAQEFSGLVSIWKASVSYAQTVKALVPLFTVIFCQLLFRERQTLWIYLSLIPIMGGVGLATATEFDFDYVGLLAGLGDAGGFSLLSLFIKKLMIFTGMHSFESLTILGRSAFLLVLPIWACVDLRTFLTSPDKVSEIDWYRVSYLLAADGVLNFLQNVVASMVLALVAVLTYAVANSFKRILTIGFSFLIFSNPVHPLNVVGMVLAVSGVFTYSTLKAKQNQNNRKKLSLISSASVSIESRKSGFGLDENNNEIELNNNFTLTSNLSEEAEKERPQISIIDIPPTNIANGITLRELRSG